MTFRDKQVLEPTPEPAPRGRVGLATPVFSYGLIAAAVLRFLYDYSTRSGHSWALYGPLVRSGEWWRLLSYALEHGGPLHIFFNMSAVYTLGAALERGLGTWRFALVSLATCLGSAAFALFFSFGVPTVGASGMILGWAGAMLPISTRAGRQNLLIWLVQVAVISLLPGVSWQGHLGGFLFGLPCGIALRAGPRWFNLLGPVLVVIAAAIAVVAANPQALAR